MLPPERVSVQYGASEDPSIGLWSGVKKKKTSMCSNLLVSEIQEATS